MASRPGKIDLSEFFRYSRPKKKPCAVGFAVEALNDSEREQLQAACEVDSGLITTSAIVQWLAARGHEVTSSAATSHRRKTCSCHD